MAEFQEVLRQMLRMCDTQGCSKCDLMDCCPGGIGRFSDKSLLVESTVMAWAKEHPESQYPSWEEWQREAFPDARFPISMCHFMNHACLKVETCAICRKQPIPADIAEKLGIKLKEAGK